MVDFSGIGNKNGETTEEQIQREIAGDECLLHFVAEGQTEPFFSEAFKEGMQFDWVKNKVAEKMEARYEDLNLYLGEKRIPEPFCLVDMGVQSNTTIGVKLNAGAVIGNEALREQVLKEIAM
jgi:hypothetical protein